MTFPFLLLLISILDVGAVVMARYYLENRKPWVMSLSLLLFAASAYVYVSLMAFRSTAIINVLSAASSTIFVTLFYYFVFKERITKGQWAGLSLAMLGILILEV